MVRPAVAADLDALVRIHERSSRLAYAHIFPPDSPFPTWEAMAARWTPALVDDGAAVVAFVAESDGVAIGGVIADVESRRGFGNLRHLYVDPAAWGGGAGRLLHDAAVRWCAAAGLTSMELWVLERNERARAMYERWGWEQVAGEVLHHEGVPVSEVAYRLGRLPHP